MHVDAYGMWEVEIEGVDDKLSELGATTTSAPVSQPGQSPHFGLPSAHARQTRHGSTELSHAVDGRHSEHCFAAVYVALHAAMKTSDLYERFTRSATGLPRRRIHFTSNERYAEKRPTLVKQDQTHWQTYMDKTFLTKRPLAAILVVAATLLAVLLLRTYSVAAHHYGTDSRPHTKYLQLLIPTSRMADVDLCKTILTAQVLNYPVPVLIPWGNSSTGLPVAKRARMQSKVAHTYKYLKGLPVEMDDAVTILLDGPDTWFQLRPDQLLQQYFEVMASANSRLRKQYGEEQAVEQKLLFAAQNSCVSKNAADLACSAIPAPVRDGAPRYMGNGAIIGKTKHLRAFLKRAYHLVQKDPPNKLLSTYSEIFGQQEYQRKSLKRSPPPSNGLKRYFGFAERIPEKNNTVPPLPTPHNETYEFGIGLDYNNNIGFATSLGADKVDWRKQHPLTKDMIASSLPPFWTVSGREPHIPHAATWSDISLLRVKDTDTIPAMIHHQPTALSGADSSHMRRDWWSKLWLQPHARALYTSAEQLPATAVAAVVREDGQEELYWNRHTWTDKAGAWMPDNEFSRWQDICGAEKQWKEVFRDDQGPWTGLDDI